MPRSPRVKARRANLSISRKILVEAHNCFGFRESIQAVLASTNSNHCRDISYANLYCLIYNTTVTTLCLQHTDFSPSTPPHNTKA